MDEKLRQAHEAAAAEYPRQKGQDAMKANVPIEEGRCPMCGSRRISHAGIDWHGEQFCQECTCDDCNFYFRQWYTATFGGMTAIDDDGCSNVDIESPDTQGRKTFEFEVALSVSDYYDAPHGFEFESCRGDREFALEVAANELLEAGVSQETLDRMQMTAKFVEFDSPNPSHAAGHFKIYLTGDDTDVNEAEQKWTARMDGRSKRR